MTARAGVAAGVCVRDDTLRAGDLLPTVVPVPAEGMCASDASESPQLDAWRVLRGRVLTEPSEAGALDEVSLGTAPAAAAPAGGDGWGESMAKGMMGAFCLPAPRSDEPRTCDVA